MNEQSKHQWSLPLEIDSFSTIELVCAIYSSCEHMSSILGMKLECVSMHLHKRHFNDEHVTFYECFINYHGNAITDILCLDLSGHDFLYKLTGEFSDLR